MTTSMASWWWGATTREDVNVGSTTSTSTTSAIIPTSTNTNIARRTSSMQGTTRDIEEAAPKQQAAHEHSSTTTSTANTNTTATKNNTTTRRPSLKPPTDVLLQPSIGIEKSPASRGLPGAGHLPLTMNNKQAGVIPTTVAGHVVGVVPEPKLIHPIFNKISVTTRFAFNGMLSNVLFMMAYNWSIQNVPEVAPPTMYSIVYLVFIPIGHAMVSLFVFGWPEHYCPSLMSNFPIGLTAIGIGGGLTAWLDSIDFNEMVADYVRSNFTFSAMPKLPGEEAGSQFYSSIVVLVVTSLWTYVLSIYVNSPPEKSEKKEL